MNKKTDSNTYQKSSDTPEEVIHNHKEKLKGWKIRLNEKESCLPFMYWVPKMHKTPSKQRFIAASACCSTKTLSTYITKCLKVIDRYHMSKAHKVQRNCGINSYWIINHSSTVHQMIKRSNEMKNVKNVATYDF